MNVDGKPTFDDSPCIEEKISEILRVSFKAIYFIEFSLSLAKREAELSG